MRVWVLVGVGVWICGCGSVTTSEGLDASSQGHDADAERGQVAEVIARDAQPELGGDTVKPSDAGQAGAGGGAGGVGGGQGGGAGGSPHRPGVVVCHVVPGVTELGYAACPGHPECGTCVIRQSGQTEGTMISNCYVDATGPDWCVTASCFDCP